ncbi:MAG TPA: MFS transporter [Chthoniobacterales bacterium]|nr:MFS transporter [Chthoniobacterales bacterium]
MLGMFVIYNRRAGHCNRHLSMEDRSATARRYAGTALALLLAINLFNYIDRYILAAVLPILKQQFLANDPNQNGKAGLWTTAFLVSYFCTAPVFGLLADRFSRWRLVGISVAVWSLASGWSGMATSFAVLLCTRIFVGIGEAGYGPAAPTIIADLYPLQTRGRVLAWFYVAIPVGSALGYAFGGKIADLLGWRWAFYLVVPPGLLLAAICFFMRDPRRTVATESSDVPRPRLRDYVDLFRVRSYLINTAAMTVMTFAIGGFSAWMPDYIFIDRHTEFAPSEHLLGNIGLTFGAITAAAGLSATLTGGWLGDKLRSRFASSYFLVSGVGMLICFPATIAVIYVRFPLAWLMIFIAEFFLFLNTGPSNTALANVTSPLVRASAFALNIFIIHLFGDATSPPLIGMVRDRWNMNVALFGVAVLMVLAGFVWLWGARFLPRDTMKVERATAQSAARAD